MINFPRHDCGLYLTHNEHKDLYMSIEDAIEDTDESDWVSEDERKKALETNNVWSLQWYPDTPVGFYKVHASSLDVLLSFVEENYPNG